ncbi:MAG: DUF4258 domain-containing protein [Legionellaceae bacterium]|nr:DUF4258 domain-containing protein [Legionellaceae bacterium]
MQFAKRIEWSDEKNTKLIAERGIGFEEVYTAIQNGYLLGIVRGKEPKYTHQRIFVVLISGYTYAVPFVEEENKIFLKTLYPSRELHKKYGNGDSYAQ